MNIFPARKINLLKLSFISIDFISTQFVKLNTPLQNSLTGYAFFQLFSIIK